MRAFEEIFGRGGWRRVRTASVGVVLVSVLAVVALGATSKHDNAVNMTDGSAWIVNSAKGEIVHVDGPTHEANAVISNVSARGSNYQVTQTTEQAWVVDSTTGTVRHVDNASLSLDPGADAPGGTKPSDLSLFVSPEGAYEIDASTGDVWLVDAHGSTTHITSFGGPIAAGISSSGVLWVAASADGSLGRIDGGVVGRRTHVFPKGDMTRVMVVAGRAVVVDARAGAMFSDTGARTSVGLGADVESATLEQGGSTGWIAAGSPARLLGVGPNGDVVVDIPLSTSGSLGPPVTNAGLVYVPDYGRGAVLIVDPSTKQVRSPQSVGSAGGEPFDLLAQNGYVFASASDRPGVVVFDASGHRYPVNKNDPRRLQHPSKKTNTTSAKRAPTPATTAPVGSPVKIGKPAPPTRPDPPRFVGIPDGNKQTITAVLAPSSARPNAQPTSYTMTADDGHQRVSQSAQAAGSGAVTVSISGLRNGHSYTLTATAKNAKGTSDAARYPDPVYVSAKDYPSAPGAPTFDSSVAKNDGELVVSWSAPTDTGGWDLDGYDVTLTGSDGKTVPVVPVGNVTTAPIHGLTNGVTYTVSVAARVDDGGTKHDGASSPARTAVPFTKPDAPTLVQVTGNGKDAVLVFEPGVDGGRPATYQAFVDNQATGVTIAEAALPTDGSPASLSVSGFDDRATHTFVVRATNEAGYADSTSSQTAFGIPDTPSITGLDVGDGYYDIDVGSRGGALSWTPGSDGGEAVTSFTVNGANVGNTTSTSVTVSPGATFTVAACNADGCSAASGAATAPTMHPYKNISADVGDESTAPSHGPCANSDGAVIQKSPFAYSGTNNTGTCAFQGSAWQALCQVTNGYALARDGGAKSSVWYQVRAPGGAIAGYLSQWWVGGYPASLGLPGC